MTAILLPNPEPQFCDANGVPYAGGTVETYIMGTSTPKQTWLDPDEAALNTNPIVLDAAGRCVMYGDGDYRLILRDAAGNQIWDQPSSTVVSAAMEPVVSAPTIDDAKILLGITGFATSADLASAISTEQTARIAADNAEATTRNASDVTLAAAIADLQTQIDAINAALGGSGSTIQAGVAVTDGSGSASVTFGTPYTTTPVVVASCTSLAPDVNIASVQVHPTNFTAYAAFGSPGVTPAPGISVYWIATGPT